jgi:N-acetylmuramoyl-L-alanine amidase
MPLGAKALDAVTRTIIAEAENEGPAGWQAVANVLKNRADSGAWGDPAQEGGMARVIYAPKQFTSWNPGNPRGEYARSVSVNSPIYQRVAQVAQAVFSGQLDDNTNRATHFYNPKLAQPAWATGTPTQIGAHTFMTLPLNAATTAGTVDLHAPPPGAASSAGGDPAQEARSFLASLSQHGDRPGDTANLNPQFAVRLAAAIKQARAEGLPIGLTSAFREPGQTGSAYDAGGNSSHSYGLASDIAGLDGPNGRITQRWAQIAQANGLSNPYGTGNATEFNHWQLPAVPLERTPQLLAALKAAKATGNYQSVWDAYSNASPESQVATRQSYPPVAAAGAPAPQASPAAAVAPAAGAPAPQASPAATVAPAGSAANPQDRFIPLERMTTGTGARNAPLITALNLTPGVGSTPAPAAAAPAAPAAQSVPLDETPKPVPRPTSFPGPPKFAPDRYDPLAPANVPPMSPPNPVTASAQNLLRMLFPTG